MCINYQLFGQYENALIKRKRIQYIVNLSRVVFKA